MPWDLILFSGCFITQCEEKNNVHWIPALPFSSEAGLSLYHDNQKSPLPGQIFGLFICTGWPYLQPHNSVHAWEGLSWTFRQSNLKFIIECYSSSGNSRSKTMWKLCVALVALVFLNRHSASICNCAFSVVANRPANARNVPFKKRQNRELSVVRFEFAGSALLSRIVRKNVLPYLHRKYKMQRLTAFIFWLLA